MNKKRTYTTLLTHGGALIDETRILLDRFDPQIDTNRWVEDIIKENALGKASRAWASEIINRYFVARYVNGYPKDAWKPLKILCSKGVDLPIIRSIMYYHTAKIDDFLFDVVADEVFERYYSGRMDISADDVYRFIEASSQDRFENPWSESVKGRLSRGIMSVLRDFGILDGRSKKRIANFYLPIEVFVYVAFIIHSSVSTGEMIVNHADWKLFLLKPRVVESIFLEAHQHGWLNYNAAGNLIRIEFSFHTLEELANEIASRAH